MSDDICQQLDLPDLNQVGFVVRDMAKALALYEPMFGPFSLMDPGPMEYDYRGRKETCEMRLAFGKSGDVEIELIEPQRGRAAQPTAGCHAPAHALPPPAPRRVRRPCRRHEREPLRGADLHRERRGAIAAERDRRPVPAARPPDRAPHG